MDTDKFVKDILQHALHLGEEVKTFNNSTSLLGSLPELDSIGVVNIITMIEDQLGCSIEDDEINAEVFETFGSLVNFIETNL